MSYTNRPFNPNTPYENQVETELELANNNFDILRQAFVSDNPMTFIVKQADTVDGFHASLTPAPNTIIPLNAGGILDLSATYVRSSVFTFRRVNLTGATSDYDLQVGEEAIINFNNANSVPLRIATASNRLYEIYIQFSVNVSSGFSSLNPNNTTYSSSFSHVSYFFFSNQTANFLGASTTSSAFTIFNSTPHCYCVLNTTRRVLMGFTGYEVGNTGIGVGLFASKWHSSLSAWTSLGTLSFPTSMSGYVLVRRLG
jgi:hypothetical protein